MVFLWKTVPNISRGPVVEQLWLWFVCSDHIWLAHRLKTFVFLFALFGQQRLLAGMKVKCLLCFSDCRHMLFHERLHDLPADHVMHFLGVLVQPVLEKLALFFVEFYFSCVILGSLPNNIKCIGITILGLWHEQNKYFNSKENTRP